MNFIYKKFSNLAEMLPVVFFIQTCIKRLKEAINTPIIPLFRQYLIREKVLKIFLSVLQDDSNNNHKMKGTNFV
jgi:hypothetical protein